MSTGNKVNETPITPINIQNPWWIKALGLFLIAAFVTDGILGGVSIALKNQHRIEADSILLRFGKVGVLPLLLGLFVLNRKKLRLEKPAVFWCVTAIALSLWFVSCWGMFSP